MSSAWLLFLVSVAIVTINAITIVIFTRCPRLRMRRYILIVNLAVADCLVGLTAVSLYIYMAYIHPSNSVDDWITFNFQRAFDMVFGIGSLYSLAAVTGERTYATYFPFKHRVLSKTKYIVGICIVWSISVMLCVLTVLLESNVPALPVITIVVFAILCPISIVIIGYFLIWIKVNYNRALPHTIHQSNAKLTVTLGIVTLVTLIAWIPFTSFSIERIICNVYGKCIRALATFLSISKWLQYSNSIVNFAIYALRMRDFQMEIKRRIRCCCGRQLSQEIRQNEPANIVQPSTRCETANNNQLTTRCDENIHGEHAEICLPKDDSKKTIASNQHGRESNGSVNKT